MNIQHHQCCQEETLLCLFLTGQVQRPWRPLCHLLRLRDEQEQAAAKGSDRDLGSHHTQMGDTIIQHHYYLRPPSTSQVPGALRAPELPESPLAGSLQLLSSLAPHLLPPGKSTENRTCPVPTGGHVAGREEVPRGGHAIPLEQSQPGRSHLH